MNKHDKLRVFTTFQHWLGTNYTDLPTDSSNMTERARRYLKEHTKARIMTSKDLEYKK